VAKKIRADLLVVERGLAETRSRAQALILGGKVFRGEQRVEKSGQLLPPDARLELRGMLRYVSRGGLKMEGALDEFAYDPDGAIVADFGASTGGFTDCLLQRGASKVYAIDVGYGQLHPKLRDDPRVVVMERCNARHLTELDDPLDLIVIDASFIGIEKLLPAAKALLREGGEVLAMVKPQFQVGRDKVGAGGVVRDPDLRRKAVDDVVTAAQKLGFEEHARADSPIQGPKGNQETFLWLRRS